MSAYTFYRSPFVARGSIVRFVQRFEYDVDEEMDESTSELFDEIESTKTGYDIAMKVYPIQKQDEVLAFFYIGEFSASVYFGKSLPNSTEPFLTKEMKHLAIEQGGDYIGFLPYEWENQVPLMEFIRNDHHHFDTFEETEVFHTPPISIQQDIKKRFVRWFNSQEEEQLILLPYDEFEFILKEA